MSLWGNKDNLALAGSTYDISAAGVVTRVTGAVDFTAAATLATPGDTLVYDSAGTPLKYIVKSVTSATVLQLTDTSGVSAQSGKAAFLQQAPKHLTKSEMNDIYFVDADVEMAVVANQTGQHSGWNKATIGTGGVERITVLTEGSGYASAPAVTVGGAATATAVLTGGHVTSVTVTAPSSGYTSAASVTLAAPTAATFDGISAVDDSTELITVASNPFQDGDLVLYLNGSGNSDIMTAGGGAGNTYYVVATAVNDFSLSLTLGGAAIDLTDSNGAGNHSLTGETATASPNMGKRTGRRNVETLVATGTKVAVSGDAEDVIFPNS